MQTIIMMLLGLMLTFDGYSQSCKEVYKNQLERNAELISCGANFTIEKNQNGNYIVKRYYTENKTITQFATYKSNKLKVLDGLFQERWDDGTVVNSGQYSDNMKVGPWRENTNQFGFYEMGKKQGTWKTLTSDSLLIEETNYLNGVLHGKHLKYDSTFQITLEEEFENGDLIGTTLDSTAQMVEEMPQFPGCEASGLEKEELQKCSERKLLEYVYGSLKYPNKSRNLNIEGRAVVQFLINDKGNVVDIKVLNGLSKDIKQEVLSLVENMPKWKPGTQDGKPVKVLFTLPITFRLN